MKTKCNEIGEKFELCFVTRDFHQTDACRLMKGLTCLRNNIHVYSTPECIYVMDGWFLSAARKNKHISSVENMF